MIQLAMKWILVRLQHAISLLSHDISHAMAVVLVHARTMLLKAAVHVDIQAISYSNCWLQEPLAAW